MKKLMLNFILLIFIFSCEKAKDLQPLTITSSIEVGSIHAEFCDPKFRPIKTQQLNIFLVDGSASASYTDPTYVMRFDGMFRYAQPESGHADDLFLAVAFNDDSYEIFPWTQRGEVAFPYASDALYDAYNNPSSWGAGLGFSDMPLGVSYAKAAIVKYIEDNYLLTGQDGLLQINFMLASDGWPMRTTGEIPVDSIKEVFVGSSTNPDAGLMGLLKNDIYGKYISKINVYSTYFWGNILGGIYGATPNQDHEDLMRLIAEWTEGRFLTFNFGKPVNYNVLGNSESKLKKELFSIHLDNQSFVFNTKSKQPEIDSDGDRISDASEINFGSNPQLFDTDGDGLSDGVQLNISGKPCRKADCSAASIFPLCISYLNSSGKLEDIDGDGFNTCDEKMLGTSAQSADTNQNGLMDGVEFRIGMNPSLINSWGRDSDGDKISDMQEFLQFRPWNIHSTNTAHHAHPPTEYNLKKAGYLEDGRSCYDLVIKNVPSRFAPTRVDLYLVYKDYSTTEKTYAARAISSVTSRGMTNIANSDFQQVDLGNTD